MKTWKIRDIIPGKASEGTLTPGRRFLQVIADPVPDEGYLSTERTSSRNVWDSFLGASREDGTPLNIAGDQLFLSICDVCGITSENIDSINWEPGSDAFTRAIGMKLKATLEKEYVEPYTIPNSQSKLSERYTYTTLVFEGEDKFQVFRNQGHVVVQDPDRLEEIKRLASETARINEEAREDRQHDRGVASVGEREGTGSIIKERTLGTRGMSAEDGEDPALNRDENRKKPKSDEGKAA